MWPILNCHYLQQRQLAKEQEIVTNHFVTLHMITVRNGKQSFWTGGSIPEAVFFGRNMHAVRHRVLAKIDPDQIDCLGEAARQPPAGFQPLAGKN